MSTKEQKVEIENPWAIYSGVMFPIGVGKVLREYSKGDVTIQYSEGQMYPPESWDGKYVERFSTIVDAAKNYFGRQGEYHSLGRLAESLANLFPSEKESLAELLE